VNTIYFIFPSALALVCIYMPSVCSGVLRVRVKADPWMQTVEWPKYCGQSVSQYASIQMRLAMQLGSMGGGIS